MVFGAATSLMLAGPALAAEMMVKLATNVTAAPEGYEPVATQYIVANPVRIRSTHFMYGGNVLGELKRGERVEALAKVKGYEWIVVGRNGEGIGYVPISMLAPADKYVP
jgi:hypothetical protein